MDCRKRIYVKSVAHYRCFSWPRPGIHRSVLEAGDRVVATARNPEQLVELESKHSGRVCTVALDVTNAAPAKAAFEAAIASFGGLDVLVNNAGYGHVSPVEDTPF
jgi:NAD(P)-dependent dehydrogenase (short-subunit alcohol dehydrogenase family)